MVPTDDLQAEFGIYQHPKVVMDDLDVFPTVARIRDSTLHKVDPANQVLLAYLQTINPSIETGVLLEKGINVKKVKPSKKGV